MGRDLDLLVVGDANPDLVLRGGALEPAFGQREQLVEEAALVVGGSAAIMACGAARLGLRTALVACVGADALGRFMLDALAERGVDTGAVRVLDDVPTGVTVALARPADRAILTAPGAMAALAPADAGDALLRRARHVHVASPFLVPAVAAGLAGLAERAHAAGATVSLDTGWDPAERWDAVAAGLAAVDVLLPNAQEAAHLAGRPDAAPEAAAAALAAGGALVVVKLGAGGALARKGADVVRAGAPAVAAVDATGAGDSFDAGFLAGWLDGLPLADALALGCRCGALSTLAAGGTAAQPTREQALAA